MPTPVKLSPRDKKVLRASVEGAAEMYSVEPKLVLKRVPERVLRLLSRPLLLALFKIVSAQGFGPGLRTSDIEKLSNKEMAKYIFVVGGGVTILNVMVMLTLGALLHLFIVMDTDAHALLIDKDAALMYTKAIMVMTFVCSIAHAIAKRTFAKFDKKPSARTLVDVENGKILAMVEGRAPHVRTTGEKWSMRAWKASLFVGGTAGMALLFYFLTCDTLRSLGVKNCTNCEEISKTIVEYQNLLELNDVSLLLILDADDRYKGLSSVSSLRRHIKRIISFLKVANKSFRCPSPQKSACEVFSTLVGVKSCEDLTCTQLGLAYRGAAERFRLHPDKLDGLEKSYHVLTERRHCSPSTVVKKRLFRHTKGKTTPALK